MLGISTKRDPLIFAYYVPLLHQISFWYMHFNQLCIEFYTEICYRIFPMLPNYANFYDKQRFLYYKSYYYAKFSSQMYNIVIFYI